MPHDHFLGELPWLARLPTEDRQALAHRARLRQFPAGTALVTEGSVADALFVITEGRARVVVSSGTGEEATLAMFGPGEPIGEFSIFDGLPRSASVIATIETTALMITREAVIEWVRARPDAAVAIIETLATRLRRTNQRISDLSFLDLPHRLAKQLVTLAALYDIEAATINGSVRLKITQGELASMLGVSRESVNKQLNVFSKQGLITISRGALTLDDIRSLREFS